MGDIVTFVPPSVNQSGVFYSVSLNDLVNTYHYWGDDDGDGQGTNGLTATGNLSVNFADKNNLTVSRSDILDPCKAPYEVRLRTSGGSLTTQYGVPNSSTFGRSSLVVYYISPKQAKVCHARPSLYLGSADYFVSNATRDDSRYAGPSSIWNPEKGFLMQSTTPSSYGLNFPTTGADGLYFDLDIGGVDENQLTWSPVTHEGITAAVHRVRPRSGSFSDRQGNNIQYDAWIHDRSQYVTRVTLNGPKANNSQTGSNNPSRLSVPILPQTFELEGRDSSGNVVVKYGFVLQKWFVDRTIEAARRNHSSWCSSLGYRMPQVRDLTNAVKTGSTPVIGAMPSSTGNYYERRIGGGFFSEWGISGFYNIKTTLYWASDVADLFVDSFDGHIENSRSSFYRHGICVTP
ncbi:hypothetical protein GA0061081_101328 [Gilliamella bombicola]|uniref:Uncharacterized protein n=2 Tax=Gilliamella bombicola TaxID=1798182 RepID=A0A1C3ZBQ1_9GAMM|nr:hypothetical protein GA0061081_101328 [Gilliamella bombicola]